MASLQDLKKRLSSPTKRELPTEKIQKSIGPLATEKSTPNLEIEEARYLLSLIAKSEFSGKDIQIVYDTALKLQEIIKNNLEENG